MGREGGVRKKCNYVDQFFRTEVVWGTFFFFVLQDYLHNLQYIFRSLQYHSSDFQITLQTFCMYSSFPYHFPALQCRCLTLQYYLHDLQYDFYGFQYKCLPEYWRNPSNIIVVNLEFLQYHVSESSECIVAFSSIFIFITIYMPFSIFLWLSVSSLYKPSVCIVGFRVYRWFFAQFSRPGLKVA